MRQRLDYIDFHSWVTCEKGGGGGDVDYCGGCGSVDSCSVVGDGRVAMDVVMDLSFEHLTNSSTPFYYVKTFLKA